MPCILTSRLLLDLHHALDGPRGLVDTFDGTEMVFATNMFGALDNLELSPVQSADSCGRPYTPTATLISRDPEGQPEFEIGCSRSGSEEDSESSGSDNGWERTEPYVILCQTYPSIRCY